MPIELAWYEFIIAAAAVVTAVGVLGTRIVRPIYNFAKALEDFYPMFDNIKKLVQEFQPETVHTLKQDVQVMQVDIHDLKDTVDEIKVHLEFDFKGETK